MNVIGKLRKVWRSAITGRFVTRRYAEQHPATTISERVHPAHEPEDARKREVQ